MVRRLSDRDLYFLRRESRESGRSLKELVRRDWGTKSDLNAAYGVVRVRDGVSIRNIPWKPLTSEDRRRMSEDKKRMGEK